jgi:hypothetical protein
MSHEIRTEANTPAESTERNTPNKDISNQQQRVKVDPITAPQKKVTLTLTINFMQ